LLAGECRELGDDRTIWRRHFTDRVARLVGADAGIQGEMAGCLTGRNIDLGNIFWLNAGDAPPPFWIEHLTHFRGDPGYSPAMIAYHNLTRRERGRAVSRTEFLADGDWYGSHDFLKIHEPLGVDATLWCFRPIPGVVADESSGLLLARSTGRRDFGPRDREIAREAHALIAPLIGGALARFADPSPLDLTPAKRRVLAHLLQGDGEKQIAARLRLSTYTVNEYAQVIYRHFRVRSRAELLARWIRRGWNDRFSWLDNE
jgi:DNA-binding CsgD family transcriptional regulator